MMKRYLGNGAGPVVVDEALSDLWHRRVPRTVVLGQKPEGNV